MVNGEKMRFMGMLVQESQTYDKDDDDEAQGEQSSDDCYSEKSEEIDETTQEVSGIAKKGEIKQQTFYGTDMDDLNKSEEDQTEDYTEDQTEV